MIRILSLNLILMATIGWLTSSVPLMGQEFPVIPVPQKIEAGKGTFLPSTSTQIFVEQRDEAIDWAITYLNGHLQSRLGAALQVRSGKPGAQRGIAIGLDAANLAPEAYKLSVDSKGIQITAGSAAGVFYAVQSLIQIFPDAQGPLAIPAVMIEDHPAFSYRGMHLDVGRHFFPVSFIKQYIDILSRYKMNRFHWHLTEDQGWRIEIKRYPKLQEIAAFRDETLKGHYNDVPQVYDGKRYGGYYTQDEVREVVEYARRRFVTIVPEIEMPGHAQAAIAAYPELGCTGNPVKVATKWGVFEDVFCPSETTFTFLENVLREVMDLFPGEYIHIGGDECPKTQWKNSPVAQEVIRREGLKDEYELQSYFIRRIEKFLNANGRQIIGWDEILEGGIAPNATIMSWRGVEGGIEAAKQNHNVIMTPTSFCYLDYYQALGKDEPLAIGGFLPLEKVYAFNPVPAALQGDAAKFVIGAQGNVWTEYMQDEKKVQYMVYPRMQALSEVVWSGEAKKDFPGFIRRLVVHLERLQKEGVNFANHLFDVKAQVIAGDGKGVRVRWYNLAGKGDLHTLEGSGTPGPYDPKAEGEIPLTREGRVHAQTILNGAAVGKPASLFFVPHLAAGKVISLAKAPAAQYSAAGPASAINGVIGSDERYGDDEWQGFEGDDFDAVIDFGTSTPIRKVNFRFYNAPGQWIYPPKAIHISFAEAPGQFDNERTSTISVNRINGNVLRQIVLANGKGRYMRVRIENYGMIPQGQEGAGHRAWLFVDEIMAE